MYGNISEFGLRLRSCLAYRLSYLAQAFLLAVSFKKSDAA